MSDDRTTWKKSSYSGGSGGNCIEVACAAADGVAVRDSKDREGPKLAFEPGQWRRFAAGLKAGRFDVA
jgi:ABC-type amino acid transport substrate-binding protein